MEKILINQIQASILTKTKILENKKMTNQILLAVNKIIECYNNGGKTLIAGNGGSAADAQHIAGEFVSKFYFDRPGMSSIALSTDTSIMTAIGNDYGYDKLFSRQIQAQGTSGDVFIGISTSGNSENIVEALNSCRQQNIITIGLTGQSQGKMDTLCDICIKVPSDETPRIQESHILIGHIICCIVEERIFSHYKRK